MSNVSSIPTGQWRGLAGLAKSLAAMAFATWFAFYFHLGLASAGFLYLVLVVVTAVYGGFWTATAISLVAVMCLNYFFVPPVFTFFVSSPADLAALFAFEFTALVVNRLSYAASRQRVRADEERRDSESLYETSRRILLFDRSEQPGPMLASLIREVFVLDGVLLFDAASASVQSSGCGSPQQEERTRRAYYWDATEFDAESATWFCVVRLGARPIGGLALCGRPLSPLVASALASLCAIAMERTRSLEREVRAEAARQSEQLRAGVLDALAHDFKTPVTTIWAASTGLLAAGGLSEMQADLLTLIDEQSKRLNDLSSRLLGTARLDSVHFEPRRQPLLLSRVARAAIQGLKSAEARGRFRVFTSAPEARVSADGELILAAVAQLVDNAVKYSTPGSAIEVRFGQDDAEGTIRIRNQGVTIKPSDRDRIFERFYRANANGHGPAGTGLGLSIVQRIVEAHHGRVWVESEEGQGTTFFVALPLAPQSVQSEESGVRAMEAKA